MDFNMASNANIGINRKRRDNEYNYQSDDFSQNTFDNTHKKVKMEQELSNSPSKVVHVRNLPLDLDDSMITFLAVPFGFIDNIVFVRKNCQALIQMREVSDAVEMVDYFSQYVPLMYGKHLFVQFSKHQQLDIRANNNVIDLLLQRANEKREHYLSNWANNSAGASEILRILIDNAPNLTINHLVFYKIFFRFGQIVRIVSYTKNGLHHGLIEFANALPAHVAQLQLNGINLLGENGMIRVDFSKIAGPLQVQRQSDKVRDYLENPLTPQELSEMDSPQYSFPLFSLGRSNAIGRGHDQNQFVNSPYKYMPERLSVQSYYDGSSQLSSMAGHGGREINPAEMAAVNLMTACNQMNNNRGSDSRNWGFDSQSRSDMYNNKNNNITSESSVVLITNLNPEKSNPDALFTLFGVYGDVLRVKVMFNKRSTALVQYANHQQALTAVNNLDSIFLWGKQMHLHISKSNNIQMPMQEANHGMTKDYSESNLHRFMKPNSKNFQNIYPPHFVLHLSNIPPTTSEEDLLSLFQNAGYVVKKFKFLPNDRKMALVEFGSAEDAIHALIEFHNFKLSEKNNLRLKFSKSGSF